MFACDWFRAVVGFHVIHMPASRRGLWLLVGPFAFGVGPIVDEAAEWARFIGDGGGFLVVPPADAAELETRHASPDVGESTGPAD